AAGASSVVLEAREVGWGGSGRAFGQVVPYAKHDHAHILGHFGADWGERMIAMLAGGPDLVFELIERHGIACDGNRNGLIFAAHTADAAKTLEERARFWQARKADVSFLDAAGVTELTGSTYYPAAVIDRRGGCLDPLAYARGLGHAAVKAGVKLFEQSRVTRVERQGGRWVASAADGAVEAESLVLATDAYTDGLWPGLQQSLIPLRGYHLTTAPLSENLRKTIMPGGQSLTDTRRLYSGIRLRSDGRLHVSTDGPAFTAHAHAFVSKAAQRVQDLFPQLGDPQWQAEIAGWVGMTTDQYPHLHDLAPGAWAAVGLSGRGIAFGTLLGRELSKRILRKAEAECAMPVTPLRGTVVRPLARPLVGGLMNWYRIRDRAELGRGYVGAVKV
ncbi:MAG TPA: FAD-binding oxidoreductase, partial [Stellaceae bacterium]|nr:FAD-binding oxidoreductase [Stellaceae bacterium]